MDQPIVQGLLTFLGGAVVAGLNALLSARLLDKKPAAFASFSAVRQLFNVAYLVLVFFGSRALGWDVTSTTTLPVFSEKKSPENTFCFSARSSFSSFSATTPGSSPAPV